MHLTRFGLNGKINVSFALRANNVISQCRRYIVFQTAGLRQGACVTGYEQTCEETGVSAVGQYMGDRLPMGPRSCSLNILLLSSLRG